MKLHTVAHQPISIFYSYAHEDEALRKDLEKHLSLLRRQGIIQEWHDRDITGGSDWKDQIDQHLETAELILLLISPDFLHSAYCYDIEMARALERHDNGKAWVIPIHLRPVDWEGAAFARLQALPTNAKPVTEWNSKDEGFRQIVQGIRKAAHQIRQTETGIHFVHTDLLSPRGLAWKIPGDTSVCAWFRRWMEIKIGVTGKVLAGTLMLFVAVTVGWYIYQQHTARIALHLSDGKRFLDTGQYKLARESYQQAIAQSWVNKSPARLGLEKASVYDSADGSFNPYVAKQRINRILRQSPNDPHAYLFLGDLYAIQDVYKKASEYYKKAISHDSTLAHGYFSLGVVYDKLGELKKSLSMYENAVEHADWHQTYLNNLAYQYFRHKDYGKAIETYKRALNLDGNFLIAYFEIAHYFRYLGQPKKALPYHQKGVSLLDDPMIARLEKNQKPWYFSINDKRLHLDTLAQKRCYAYRSLAVTLRAQHQIVDAEHYQQKSCTLDRTDEQSIQAWVQIENLRMDSLQRSRNP